MWTLRIIFGKGVVVTITSRALLWVGAGLMSALLLTAFVQVLHESMDRGERLRVSEWANLAPPRHQAVVALRSAGAAPQVLKTTMVEAGPTVTSSR